MKTKTKKRTYRKHGQVGRWCRLLRSLLGRVYGFHAAAFKQLCFFTKPEVMSSARSSVVNTTGCLQQNLELDPQLSCSSAVAMTAELLAETLP